MMLISRQFGLMGNENIWAWLLHEPVDIFSIIFWQNLPGNNDCFYFWEPCNFPSLSTLKPFVHLPIRIKRICCDDDGVRASSNPISSLQCYPICSLFRVAFYTQWYSTANSWIPLMRISLKVADFISKEFTQWLEFLALLAAKFSSLQCCNLANLEKSEAAEIDMIEELDENALNYHSCLTIGFEFYAAFTLFENWRKKARSSCKMELFE